MILDTRLGNTPRWFLAPPEDYYMRVPDVVRDCVVFIGVHEVDTTTGQLFIKWGGTGFFVSVPSEGMPSGGYYYLVTAQHVVHAVQNKGFIVRANTRDGKAENVEVPPNSGNWWFHPTDANADVAVIPFGLSLQHFDYKSVASTMFLTKDTLREAFLGTGDEVYITGLFRNMIGTARNLPIVRIGNVAMMPSERVPTKYGPMNAYLIEARSLGGLSGSPVFIHTHVRPQTFLFGLMHGHWELSAKEQANVADIGVREDFADEGEKINMGIAIVVPAVDIFATLNHPELVEMRRQLDETAQRQNLPVED